MIDKEPKLAARSTETQARNYVVKPLSRKCVVAIIRNPAWISFTWLGFRFLQTDERGAN